MNSNKTEEVSKTVTIPDGRRSTRMIVSSIFADAVGAWTTYFLCIKILIRFTLMVDFLCDGRYQCGVALL